MSDIICVSISKSQDNNYKLKRKIEKLESKLDNANINIKELQTGLANAVKTINELKLMIELAPPGMYSETGGIEYQMAKIDFETQKN